MAELSAEVINIFYGLNLFLAILAVLCLSLSKKFAYQRNFKGLSKTILTFFKITFYFTFGIPLISIFASIYYFQFGNDNVLVERIERNIISFFGYFFRLSQLMVCAERLHATFVLKRDARFHSIEFGYFMVLITVVVTVVWTVPWIISDKIFYYNVFMSISLHLIVLFMIIALYHYNKRLHIFLAYKVDLKQRFQIVENIKTLKYVRPYLVISSIVAPLGPLTIAVIYFSTGYFAPFSVYYTFYNLAYFMCSFLFLFQTWKISWILRSQKIQISSISFQCTTVKNVLGKKIPAECSTEEYFMNLKKFWDST